MVEADCLIVGTPIYMIQVSGIMKNFLERLRPFLNPDLSANRLPGKKYITVTWENGYYETICHFRGSWSTGEKFKIVLIINWKNIESSGYQKPPRFFYSKNQLKFNTKSSHNIQNTDILEVYDKSINQRYPMKGKYSNIWKWERG